jgi:ornithine cyclodeaminase/alanine dehydrogenase-like protein (mu-crystallin family)
MGFEEARGLTLVAAVGATQRVHTEVSGELIARAGEVIVDCEDATRDAGEMVEAAETHGWDPSSAILLGSWLDRPFERGEAPVVFKSIGSVEQDFALALALLEAAESEGRGRTVEPVASLRQMR